MKIELKTQADCKHANETFNVFHDGFLRELQWQSPMQFRDSMPWEEPKAFPTNEEKLRATGMTPMGEECLTLTLAHYNYDWPNQPNTRAVAVRFSGEVYIEHEIHAGLVILELHFSRSPSATDCTIRWEPSAPTDGESISDSIFRGTCVCLEELDLRFSPALRP